MNKELSHFKLSSRVLLQILLLLLFVTFSNISTAQSVKLFWKFADKGEFEKIEKKLDKEKSSALESAPWQSITALNYFYSPLKVNLDSSYHHLMIADTLWENASDDKHQLWAKSFVTEDSIKRWIDLVEKAAFDSCIALQNEDEFNIYLRKYPHSLYVPNAIEIRDSLGFENAKREHSYSSYETFVRAYPNAKQVEEAREQYELLVYHSKTKNADEKALEQFLREHPENKFNAKVEGQLYRLRTEDREKEDYISFIRDYPNSSYADSAIAHLWYFATEKDSILKDYPNWKEKEYYQSILNTDKVLFPVVKENQVIFIENNGQTFLSGDFIEGSEAYNCHGTSNRYLEVEKQSGIGWVDWKGKEVVACQYDEIKPLTEGLVLVKKNKKYGIYALGEGEWLPVIYDQISRVSNRLFGVRKKARWGIISIEGESKFPIEAGQLIHISDNMVLIMKKGRWANFKESDVYNGKINTDDSNFKFEGYKLLDDQWYCLLEGGKWSVYSPNGQKWSDEFDEIKDAENKSGWLVRQDTLWQLRNFDMKVKIDSMLLPVQVPNKGIIARWGEKWSAYEWSGTKISSHQSDTLSFINNELDLLVEKDKQYWIRFRSGQIIDLKRYSTWEVTHITTDSLSPAFISAKSKKNKKYALVSEKGVQVMTPQFSKLSAFPEGVVIAKYGTLEYLYSIKGKKILKEGYTSIKYDDGVFHLKSKNKFGLFVPDSSYKVIPQFDVPLERTHLEKEGEVMWLGKKNGKYGLLTLSTANTARLYYEKMKPITKGVAFVFEDAQWKLLDIKQNKIILTCENYQINELGEGSFWIKYTKKGKYGVYTSQYGDVIYPEFSTIENMGTSQKPLFIAKQYIQQAKLNILLYMDLQGNVVYQSILNEDQYKRIECQ